MTLAVTHTTPADGTFSAAGALAWDAAHGLTGTADVAQGGTGASSFVANQILYGNGTGAIQSSADFSWNNTTKTLTVEGSQITKSSWLAPSTVSLTFTSGAGSGASPNGGSVSFSTGAGSTDGVGGEFLLTTGNGLGLGGGGNMSMTLGSGGASGVGGAMTFTAGNGAGGGTINFIGGDGVGTNQNGGEVLIAPGRKTGTGVQGYLHVSNLDLAYGIANGTGTITIGNLGPGTTARSIQRWMPIIVDGTNYITPLFNA